MTQFDFFGGEENKKQRRKQPKEPRLSKLPKRGRYSGKSNWYLGLTEDK